VGKTRDQGQRKKLDYLNGVRQHQETQLLSIKINRCKPIKVAITCTTAKMVYDWDSAKEETCYRMYIEEKRSLEEIMEYYKNQNFTPR
jgi:hypothetical protein